MGFPTPYPLLADSFVIFMNHPTFAWGRSQNKLRQEEQWRDYFCVIGLFLAALLLFCLNLGNLPLLDGTEAILAQLGQEIVQSPQRL